MMTNELRFMSIREFAELGILPEYAIRRAVKSGSVPGFYTGRKFLINERAFLDQLSQIGRQGEVRENG